MDQMDSGAAPEGPDTNRPRGTPLSAAFSIAAGTRVFEPSAAAKIAAGTRLFDTDKLARAFAGTRVFEPSAAAKIAAGTRLFDTDKLARAFAGQSDVSSLISQLPVAVRLIEAVTAAPDTSGSQVRRPPAAREPLIDDRTVILSALLVILVALMTLVETSDPVLSEHLNNVLSLPVSIVLAVAATNWLRTRK